MKFMQYFTWYEVHAIFHLVIQYSSGQSLICQEIPVAVMALCVLAHVLYLAFVTNVLFALFKKKRTKGWTYQKRPGVDALLVKLFDFYEIVVFTDEVGMVSVWSYCVVLGK